MIQKGKTLVDFVWTISYLYQYLFYSVSSIFFVYLVLCLYVYEKKEKKDIHEF